MAFASVEGDIASTYNEFHSCLEALVRSLEEDNGNEEHNREASRCVDELGRLKIWDADISASNGVLDHQLRRASHLRLRVLDLLNEVNESAAQGQMLVASSSRDSSRSVAESLSNDNVSPGASTSKTVPSKVSPPSLNQAELAIQNITTDARSADSTSLSDQDSVLSKNDLTAGSELHLQISDIRQILTLLFQLSPSLQDPAPSDDSKYAAYEGGALNDQSHVKDKFPNADTVLIQRLGYANWRRRKHMLRLKERYASTASKSNDTPQEQPLPDILESLAPAEETTYLRAPSSVVIRSEVSSVATTDPRQAFGRSSLGDSGVRTEYTRATDYSSKISLGFRYPPPDEKRHRDHRLGIPPPPSPNQMYEGRPFVCPYCLHIPLQIDSAQEWMRHVVTDIEPYICTFGDCPRPDKTYGIRKDWNQHEEELHRVQEVWFCRPCQVEFTADESFQTHFLDEHRGMVTEEQVRSVQDLCRQTSRTPIPRSICPLCKKDFGKEVVRKQRGRSERAAIDKRLKRHIADELEQLALFAVLPTGTQHDDEGMLDFLGDSESDSDLRDEIASIDLHTNDPTKSEAGVENVLKFLNLSAETPLDRTERSHPAHMTPLIQREGLQGEMTEIDKQPITFPIRTILHPRNEHFYGRDKDLHQMHQKLQKPGQICVINGIGGVGKTIMAVQYAYTYQDLYECVFWLQADTDPGLADSFGLIAENLRLASDREDQAQITDLGREWLQKTERRWLLIFDNCEAWDSVLHYMPAYFLQSQGTILITTQDPDLVKFPAVRLSLTTFDQEEGSSMLLRYLQREHIETDPERDLAREISSLVGGLPVAIAHVAGYMTYSECPFDELLEIFKQRRIATGLATDETDDLPASFRQASFSYYETLATVSHVTLRELPSDSQTLVYILAYLNCEAVPESMLLRIQSDPSLEFLDSREHMRYKRMKKQLIARRLVQMKKIDNESCFYIHRSLARSIRDELSNDKARQELVFNQALTLVQNIFPSSSPIQVPEPEKWSEHQQLLPHVLSLRSAFYEAKPNIEGSERFARLLSDAGINQWERGITKEGLVILKTAEDVLNSISSDNFDGMRANIHAIVALMYDNTGISSRAEGEKRRREALRLRSHRAEESNQVSSNDETLLYNAKMDYVISLLQYNQYREAEPIINQCLIKYREWGSEDQFPYEYAKYYHKISLVRMYQGDYAEAVKLGELSVNWMGKTGNNSLEHRFKFDLACILTQSGEIQRALEMHKEIYERRLSLCGRANEQTLQSRYAIGALYEILGDAEQAESWFKVALDCRRVANWAEEAVARTQYHLALVSRSLGKTQIADQLETEAMTALERLLPLDLPDCLKHVTDYRILFDHILTVCGARFTGQGLLELVR